LRREQIATVVSTGYSRKRIAEATSEKTEISCHAKGIAALIPGVRTLIDIGGQDSKAMAIDEKGAVSDFAMNDKCAAGTGRFLEVMAQALELKLAELNGRLAEQQIRLTLTPEAKRILAKEGFDPHYGARPLARALKRLVENPLASKIVAGEIHEGDSVVVDAAAMSDVLVLRRQSSS
jgi:hypothetical protein